MKRRKLWVVLCFSALALAAQPEGIPQGAVKAAEGYRYTDAQGHKWIYRQTPFGVSRIEEESGVAGAKTAAAAKTDESVRAVDHGDTVSFERPGPFGVYRWERKKSQMDASERAAWQRAVASAADRK